MRILLALLVVILVGVVLVQILYPRDQALPRAQLAGQAIGGKRYDELVRDVTARFEPSRVAIKAGDLSSTLPLGRTGATLESAATVEKAVDYPLWQRFLPFTLLFKQPKIDVMAVSVNRQQLDKVAEDLSKKLTVAAEDAGLAIVEGKLVTTPAKVGRVVTASDVKEALSRKEFDFGVTTITIPGTEQQPALRDDDIAPIRTRAEAITKQPIVIVAPGGMEIKPEPAVIASWLMVVKSADGGLELQADDTHLRNYVTSLNGSVGVKPGTTRVTVVDGQEVSRTNAPSGQAIASDELISGLKQALFDETAPQTLAISMVPVPPVASYDRSYTSTQNGLRAYVDYVSRSEDVRIAVSQLGGNGWSAHGRADEQLPAASTYKLYVSYMLFHQVKEGKVAWGDNMLNTDVAGCFDRMIVVSDNACAEEFIDMFGRNNLNAFLYGNGIGQATTFTSSVASQTSAADLEKLLIGIENGSKIGGADRSRLLDAMGRQKYRAGIPAGSGGKVEDKVGFLWDYLHDAAIVRHPKGTYSLVVMTKNSSWGRIAEITRQLERIMYP